MDLGSRHKVDPSFNMSSMTDIVFLLLIFFMLTSNFEKINAFPANLPKGGESIVEMTTLSLTISADGKIYIDNDMSPVSLSVLESELNSRLSKDDKTRHKESISVRGDKAVEYGQVAEVLNVAHKTGAKVSLAMNRN